MPYTSIYKTPDNLPFANSGVGAPAPICQGTEKFTLF